MHRLLVTINGTPIAAPSARITNCLGGYYTFEFDRRAGSPFGLLAQPVNLTLVGEAGPQLTIRGITRTAEGTLAGHSLAGLLDVVPRSNRFESSAPEQLIAALKKGYPEPPTIECTVKEHANKSVEQHDQTDFDFLPHAIPQALIYDTGDKLRIVPKTDRTHAVAPSDLPDGPGDWSADVTNVALSAAAHGLDPGERLAAEARGGELDELTNHPELALFLADVARFRAMIPVAKFLTTGRSAEGLRKRLQRALRRQLAQAISYTFRTTNAEISVGTLLTGLTRGPIVVVATEAHFLEGEFGQDVTAVPAPLAPHWGHETSATAESLVLATVAEGTDPLHLGRVPIFFADQPTQIVWARGGTLHAANDFQVASRFSPGEEVIVGFLHANPGAPVVPGSVFHGKNKPKKAGPRELLIQCGKLTVRLSDLGLEVLVGNSRFVVSAEAITFKSKAISGKTDAHKWEMQ